MTIGAIAKRIRLCVFHLKDLQSGQSCFCFGLRSYCEHKLIVVKQFTNRPINFGLSVQRKSKPVRILPYRYFCNIYHLLFNASESLVFQKHSDRNQSYFNLQKDFQKRKLIIFFPPLAVLHVRHTTCIYPRTPIDTPRRPLTPKGALCMVTKSYILFYMTNYHFIITFLVCITVSHRRT